MNRFKKMMVTGAAALSIGGTAVIADVNPVEAAVSCTVGWDHDSGAITCPDGVYKRVLVVTTDGGNYYGSCTTPTRRWSSRVVPLGKTVRQAYVAYC